MSAYRTPATVPADPPFAAPKWYRWTLALLPLFWTMMQGFWFLFVWKTNYPSMSMWAAWAIGVARGGSSSVVWFMLWTQASWVSIGILCTLASIHSISKILRNDQSDGWLVAFVKRRAAP